MMFFLDAEATVKLYSWHGGFLAWASANVSVTWTKRIVTEKVDTGRSFPRRQPNKEMLEASPRSNVMDDDAGHGQRSESGR